MLRDLFVAILLFWCLLTPLDNLCIVDMAVQDGDEDDLGPQPVHGHAGLGGGDELDG